MQDLAAWAGVLIWLVGLTFVAGRLYERVENMRKRLDEGDEAFDEVRAEQTAMSNVLVELQHTRRVESQHVRLLSTQTRALLVIVAKIDPRFAPAAAAAAAGGR